MNLTTDLEFTPSPKLLPFGGFEVGPLLAQLEAGDRADRDVSEQSISHQPITREVSSGWVRSKLMGG
jgi:hypothetical protein